MNLWLFCTCKRLRKFRRQRCGPGRLMLWMLTRSEPMHRASSGLQPAEHCRASTGSAPPLPQDACQISARVSILWRQKGREALRKWRDPNARTAAFPSAKSSSAQHRLFHKLPFSLLVNQTCSSPTLSQELRTWDTNPALPCTPAPGGISAQCISGCGPESTE